MMEALKDASHLYEVEHRAQHAARPGFRIQEIRLSKTQKVPWHYHNNVQDTFYVLEGELRIFLQDPQGGSAPPARRNLHRPRAPPAPRHQRRREIGYVPGPAGHRRIRFRPLGQSEMKTAYNIDTDIKFNPLELIDVRRIQQETKEQWVNQTLCRVNDCVVRLGVLQGEFHWHKHDHEDEFFYVVEGKFVIDLDGRTVELQPQQGFTVPKGVMHRTRAPVRSVILMIEGKGVVPTGD